MHGGRLMDAVREFCPAKVNLFLAITGVRGDGFHDLLSLVAPLDFGDWLGIRRAEPDEGERLNCAYPEVPTGPENLVLKAAVAFREAYPEAGYFVFDLDKRIPPGAGLGGGSSNAAAALRGMNRLCGEPLSAARLCELAATLGSDCPLFVAGRAVVMSGRGEVLEPLPERAAQVLAGQRLFIFRPGFGVSTVWAYREMKAAGRYYIPEAEARAQLGNWLEAPSWENLPLVNNLQDAVFAKHLALPAALQVLQERHGLRGMMSGSGSSCLVLPPDSVSGADLEQTVRESLGEDCLCVDCRLV